MALHGELSRWVNDGSTTKPHLGGRVPEPSTNSAQRRRGFRLDRPFGIGRQLIRGVTASSTPACSRCVPKPTKIEATRCWCSCCRRGRGRRSKPT